MQGSLHVGIRKHLSFSAEILRADHGGNRPPGISPVDFGD